MAMTFQVEDLTVAYDRSPVLWDIDFEVPPGTIMGIVGPNGAGKTTLIKAALRLINPLSGHVLFDGKPYRKMFRKVGYVPQKGSVDWDFPTTVMDVVSMGRYGHVGWIRRMGRKDKDAAREALRKVGMLEYASRQISELSGGQQQRVFIARALTQEADIYFMDEPFQGVDVKTEKAIMELFRELKAENKTVIVVHHDLNTVRDYFDWVTLLNVRVIASGRVDEVYTKENIAKTYQSDLELTREGAGHDGA